MSSAHSTGRFEPFSDITRNSLLHALADFGVTLDEKHISSVMKAYDSLSTFSDVRPTMERLSTAADLTPVVFSNGTQSMVTNSVHRSQDLAPHSAVFQDIVTVDSVRQYKPAPAVYMHLAERMGKAPSEMGEAWLVSGNPFDIVGARACGMNAIWIDRGDAGWHDAVLPGLRPTSVVRSLEQVVESIRSHQE